MHQVVRTTPHRRTTLGATVSSLELNAARACGAPANPRLERTGRRTVHHGRAARAAGRSTAGRYAATRSR
jgi:hypothetical protein